MEMEVVVFLKKSLGFPHYFYRAQVDSKGARLRVNQIGSGNGGGAGGRRDSLYSMQSGAGGSKEKHTVQGIEWGGDGLIGFPAWFRESAEEHCRYHSGGSG